MNQTLDLVASMFIGAIVLLSAVTTMIFQNEQMNIESMNVTAQENVNAFYDMFNYDITKVGYQVTSGPKFLTMNQSDIKFLGDIDDNGSVDTVRYYVGTISDLTNTPNPGDFPLYRKVNSQAAVSWGIGITMFNLRYLDASGIDTATESSVRGVEMEIIIQSPAPLGEEYGGAYAKVTFYPMNLGL